MSAAPLSHPWTVTPTEAVAIQRRLRELVVPHPPPGFAPRLVAGADLSMSRFGTTGYAAIVVLDVDTLDTVARADAVVTLRFPYVPGLLSFRELPAVEAAWERLDVKPDVLIFDGVGYAHPRRVGLACHGGLRLGVPTIGCAKSILVGTHGPLGDEAGATAPLVHKDEVVGMALRLRARVQPVYVSIGHLMDLATAVRVVQSVSTRYRLPETTRRAHQLVNELRRAGEDA
ncbi:MAG TPA: deoxyribonuclease V [Gemmatimonadaceae bacterium]|nr:deoxyribonuclease V [Gemmatimonadaceae bacterium]